MMKQINIMPLSVESSFFIILVSMLIVTGCVDQTMIKDQTGNLTTTLTGATIPVITTPTTCPELANGSYWITINPISNVSAGTPVFINGTTNIPEKDSLNIDIARYQFRALPHYVPPNVSGVVIIKKNENCSNIFSYNLNTTDLGGAGKIAVDVYSLNINLPGYNSPENQTEFYIL